MLRRISITVNGEPEKILQDIVIKYFFLKNLKLQASTVSPHYTALDRND